MTTTGSIPEAAIAATTEMPRLEDGYINLQDVPRRLTESVVNEVTDAEADQLCEATGSSRNGYRERMLEACVGTLTPRVPKLRSGNFFPEDALERHRHVDRAAVVAAVETYAMSTSSSKAQRVAAAMDIKRISRDQVSAICASLDSEVEELSTRPLGDLSAPYLWLDATYVKCRRSGRVASTAVVTAIGCDSEGWRHVLGVGVVDTESYDSWSAFLGRVRERGARDVRLVSSDAHGGLRCAVEETFQGVAWQRRAVHLMCDCAGAASGSRRTSRRVSRIVAPVFRLREAGAVRTAYHLAIEMLEGCCPEAARILEEAEPDALAYLDFPPSHWKRLHQQPAGAHQRGDKAQVARGADVPVGGVAGAPGGRRHVRPGRGVAAVEVLLGARHVRAPRRAGRAGGRGAHRRAARGPPARGQEGHRGEPRACGRAGGGAASQDDRGFGVMARPANWPLHQLSRHYRSR